MTITQEKPVLHIEPKHSAQKPSDAVEGGVLAAGKIYTFIQHGCFGPRICTGTLMATPKPSSNGQSLIVQVREPRKRKDTAFSLSVPFAIYEGVVQSKAQTMVKTDIGEATKYPSFDIRYFTEALESITEPPLFFLPCDRILMQ